MSNLLSCHFGRLISITHKADETAKDWRDALIGTTGLVKVAKAACNEQRVVFCILGVVSMAKVQTSAGTVEIKDGRLTLNTRHTIYVFEIDTDTVEKSVLSKHAIEKAALLKRATEKSVLLKGAIEKLDVLIGDDNDPDCAGRLSAIREALSEEISLLFYKANSAPTRDVRRERSIRAAIKARIPRQ